MSSPRGTKAGRWFSGWVERNGEELDGLRAAVAVTHGFSLWPVRLPDNPREARACVSCLVAWWVASLGGSLECLPIDRNGGMVAAFYALSQMCGEPVGDLTPGRQKMARMVEGRPLTPGDGAIVYHCGGGFQPGWSEFLSAVNRSRDIYHAKLGAPLLWAGNSEMLEGSWGAVDFWSIRNLEVRLVA